MANIARSSVSVRALTADLKEGLRLIRHRILRNQLQKRGEAFNITSSKTVVFAPHPDDETLGCGGFIALKRDIEAQVDVVILTDGSACFGPLPPETARDLTCLRERESVRALDVLGVPQEKVHFLRYPDGQLSVLSDRDRNTLLKQLVDLLERLQPQEILVPHELDNTPDHEATFALVNSALKASSLCPAVLQYPIWRFWSGPLLQIREPSTSESLDVRRLDISKVLDKKRKAFACYESQYSTAAGFGSATLPEGFQEAFELKYEVFFALDKLPYKGTDSG